MKLERLHDRITAALEAKYAPDAIVGVDCAWEFKPASVMIYDEENNKSIKVKTITRIEAAVRYIRIDEKTWRHTSYCEHTSFILGNDYDEDRLFAELHDVSIIPEN
jgi:hypothetical protein